MPFRIEFKPIEVPLSKSVVLRVAEEDDVERWERSWRELLARARINLRLAEVQSFRAACNALGTPLDEVVGMHRGLGRGRQRVAEPCDVC